VLYKKDMLFHLTPLDAWLEHPDRPYTTASLAAEGFIHCSPDEETLLSVANQHFATAPGPLMALLIDEDALDSPVRWEPASDRGGELFPHVYGPVNRSAVAGMLEVVRDPDGRWAKLAAWS
jgi:uncharacterized protein (DUF952 family)